MWGSYLPLLKTASEGMGWAEHVMYAKVFIYMLWVVELVDLFGWVVGERDEQALG
jgi:hypothetical protein